MTEDTIKCPNGCGEMKIAIGRIPDCDYKTAFRIYVIYCPKCFYIDKVDANL